MQDRITQSPNTFVAIYCRISSDKTGAGLGVERQEEDCRELANRAGLQVKHVLVDNDISAYSGKKRPGYEELLQLIESGEISTVIAWHTDRLHRRLRDLLDYLDAVERNGTKTITVKAGDIDLSTSQGIMLAQVSGAIAEGYVRTNTEKLQRAKLQAAKDGKFLGGQRPYGFEPQRTAIREKESKVLREIAGALVDGESYRTIAIDLNHRGIRTQHGKKWGAINVRNVIIRPINAGIVLHKGLEYDAETPAIFSHDEWVNLMAAIKLNRSRSNHPGRFRKHLLNGLLYCGICDQKLFHKSKQQRDGTYKTAAACGLTHSQTGERHGCGGVSRRVEPLIDLVTDAVIYRLDNPQLIKKLKRRGDNNIKQLLAKQRKLNDKLTEITDDYYEHSLLSRDEYERLKVSNSAQLAEVEHDINQAAASAIPSISLSEDIATAWAKGSLEWRRDLLFKLINRIEVHPKPRTKGYYPPVYKQWRFDPDLIDIKWKV